MNDQFPMTNDQSISKDQKLKSQNKSDKYDLEERTAVFGEQVISFAKKIPVNPVTREIIPQFVDAGTSIGANYAEANEAQSKKRLPSENLNLQQRKQGIEILAENDRQSRTKAP